MPTLPFSQPFGFAWFGFLIYAFAIVFAGWVLLFFAKPIINLVMFIINILALPFQLFSGKSKRGVKNITSSGKKLIKIKRR